MFSCFFVDMLQQFQVYGLQDTIGTSSEVEATTDSHEEKLVVYQPS